MEIMNAQWLKTQFKLHPDKTKADLVRALDLEPPAISKILSGGRQIKATEYVLMRTFFGLPSDGQHAVTGRALDAYIVDPLNPKKGLEDREGGTQSQWVIPAQIVQKNTQAPSEHIKSFRVEDNMMAPEFNCDEHVLVDLSNREPSPPGTFIVSDGFGFMLRHCELIPNSDPARVKLTALKESFQPQQLTLDEFQIIGRVLAKLQWL
ncbi:MAG: hypothetical protein R3E13_08785 [Alphaproteobacteria bacterium]